MRRYYSDAIGSRRESLQARLETHSDHASAIPLPGQTRQWSPTLILLDGRPTSDIARDRRGVLWLQLPRGVHQVSLSGALPARRNVQISLPLRPHRVVANVEAWEVRGLREDGQVEGQLQLTRHPWQRPRSRRPIRRHSFALKEPCV